MDHFFGLDEASLNEEGIALLTTVYDEVLASLYEGLLKEHNVPHLKKDRGSGTAMRVLMGASSQGIDFYVPDRYLAAAKELLFAPDAEIIEEGDEQ